jgi:RNA polymerase sporulation-specific sigma factor
LPGASLRRPSARSERINEPLSDLGDHSDEELVERAQAGDDRAIEILLNRYRHYARAKARSYFLVGADNQDIVQEGMIGLYHAIRDFRSERRTAFSAFAELCITRRIINAIKTATRQKHLPLNSYVSLENWSKLEEEEVRPPLAARKHHEADDPADLVISAQEIESLQELVASQLSTLEIRVLQLYVEGNSYHDIAEKLGRQEKSIDNALQRIKRKLEQHVTQQGSELQHRRG